MKFKINKKKIASFLIYFIILVILTGGFLSYRKFMQERAIRIAQEEKIKEEELAKEKHQQLIEEMKRKFEKLIADMKKYFAEANYAKVKEISEEAFLLAKKYQFQTDEVKKILDEIEIKKYSAMLKKLEEMSKNIFTYDYVRSELRKIPGLLSLRKRIRNLREKTYKNEYLVYLYLARKSAEKGQTGRNFEINYSLSKNYLGMGIYTRGKYKLQPSDEKENTISRMQNKLFFAFNDLQKNSIPTSLY